MQNSGSRRWISPSFAAGRAWLCGLALLLCPGVTVVAAHDANAPPPFPGWHDIKCACLANGRSYVLGERVCLKTPSGFRVAECRMSQNVMSWAFQPEACDVSAQLPHSPIQRAS